VFWVNVPLGLVALVASIFLLKTDKGEKSQMDLVGAGLLVASLFALLAGLTEIGNGGTSWLGAGTLFTSAGVMVTMFLWHERRAKTPIIDLEVLRDRPFLAANIFNFVMGACVMGVMAFIPLYAVSIFDMTVFQSGFILTPRSVTMIIASTVTSLFLVRWGYRQPMLVGTVFTALSLLLLAFSAVGLGTVWGHINKIVLVSGIMLLAGVGMGVSAPAANNACIELMPDRVATITGVRGMFRQIGGAVSIAVTSLVLQRVGDMSLGFFIVFTGLAAVMLVSIPAIFVMPASPKDAPPV
jgi:MFS family permease